MGFKFEVSGDSSGFHCSDSNLNAEPALTSQLWSRNCFPLLSFSWRIYNIRGLSITMRLHLSSPWRTEEKQTGFSNTLFPLEELNQTSLPTLFCPWKQPASLTAELGIYIHNVFLASLLNSTGSHCTGWALRLPYLLQSSSAVYLFICYKPIRK